jgi:hypothetical protein
MNRRQFMAGTSAAAIVGAGFPLAIYTQPIGAPNLFPAKPFLGDIVCVNAKTGSWWMFDGRKWRGIAEGGNLKE